MGWYLLGVIRLILKDGHLMVLPKWGYKNVLPYFKKLETWSGGENLYRGGKGPLKVNRSKIDDVFPLSKSLIRAAAEAGYENL